MFGYRAELLILRLKNQLVRGCFCCHVAVFSLGFFFVCVVGRPIKKIKNTVNPLGIYGYHGNRKIPFLKITVAIPRLIASTKRLLEQGFACPGYSQYGYQTYESNIDFEIR